MLRCGPAHLRLWGSTLALALAAGLPAASLPATSLPLDVAADPEACTDRSGGSPDDRLAVRWRHDAAGYQVSATSGDLTGQAAGEVVVAGPEGLRALTPGRPTPQATLWQRSFQARTLRIVLAETDGDDSRVVVGASDERADRAGVAVLDAASGRTVWSRQLPGGAAVVRTADVDGDGRDDVVAATFGDALHVLSGADGVDLHPPRPLLATPRQLQVGDLDGDGTPDAVVALDDGRGLAVDLAANTLRWTYQVLGGALETVALADVTGDGLVDAVLGGHGVPVARTSPDYDRTSSLGSLDGPLVAVLEGATGVRVWDWGTPASGSDRVHALGAGDLTGDGTPDVVAHVGKHRAGHLVALDGAGRQLAGVSLGEPTLRWAAETTHGRAGVQSAYTPEGLLVGDGDGDGHADSYLSSWSGALLGVSGGRLRPSPATDRRAPQPERLFTVARQPPHTHVSWRDGQAGAELVTASGDHLVALRDPVTGAVRWAYDAGGRSHLTVGGVGAGGAPGVAVGSAAGRLYGLDGGGQLLHRRRDVFLPERTAGVTAVDVTGDGAEELVGASIGGAVIAVDPRTGMTRWDANLGTGITAVAAAGPRQVALGTTDGRVLGLDARTGAVAWQHDGTAAVQALAYAPVRGLLAAGDRAGTIRLLDERGVPHGHGTTTTGAVSALVAADLDGDGREEFAAAAGRSFLRVSADGAPGWRYDVSEPAAFLAAGDLTGDGAADVVGSAMDGRAYALDGRSGARRWDLANGEPGPTAVADLDGDGRAVAVLSSPTPPDARPDARHAVRTVDADGAVLSHCTPRKAPHSAHVADLDGDGDSEVVMGMRQGDVYVWDAGSTRAGSGETAPR